MIDLPNTAPFIIFVLIFLFFALFDVFNIKINIKQHVLITTLLVSTMIIFAGGRWNQRTIHQGGIFDYATYKDAFENPLNFSDLKKSYHNSDNHIRLLDPGYLFLSSMFSHIFPSVHFWFLLYSLATVLLFYNFLNRSDITKYIFIVLYLYVARLYFQYNFIIMRQALAMAMVWWSIPYIHQRKVWKFILIVLLAATQHFSALIFIIVYWFPKIKFSRNFLLMVVPVMFLLGVFGVWDKIVFSGLEVVLPTFGLEKKFAAYFINNTNMLKLNPLNFIEILPFMYFAITYRNKMNETAMGRLFFNMFFFYVIFLTITMNFNSLTRLSSYFIISYFYIINFSFDNMKSYFNRIVIGSGLIIYLLCYAIRFMNANFVGRYGFDFFIFHI